MGLDFKAVNKNYGYKVNGDDRKNNKRFADASMGYIGFMRFRTELAKFYGLNNFYQSDGINSSKDSFLGSFGTYFLNGKDDGLIWKREQADVGDKDHKDFDSYLKKLDSLKEKRWFDLLPILLHSDCDGELPYRDVKIMKDKIIEFLKHTKENGHTFGYGGRDYECFEEDFPRVLEETVKNKGKIIFS